ncbi:MAG TPA: protein-L-isoaspartate(D-aspartate) O-methyltransferase [Caldilineaceae bacterium]|nr:protein-L-isoaspartate(D-aspartate) O-methyltransferase [Caldilineaceae bacterium]
MAVRRGSGPPFPWANDWPEIYDERVRAAFARVPRAEFVDEPVRRWAGRDAPLPIGEGQTISQPFVVALMTQALHLKPGDHVLEVGTGSGFQTAILCELTAQPGRPPGETVWTIERHASLMRRAARVLDRLGYRPHLMIGDGAAGWPAGAPYDAIIVTAAAKAVPRPLVDSLRDGGRMVIPVGESPDDQVLWLLKLEQGRLLRRSLGAVRFVPLVSPVLDDPAQCLYMDRGSRQEE